MQVEYKELDKIEFIKNLKNILATKNQKNLIMNLTQI